MHHHVTLVSGVRHSDSTSCLLRRVLMEEEASGDYGRLGTEGGEDLLRSTFREREREREEQSIVGASGPTCGRSRNPRASLSSSDFWGFWQLDPSRTCLSFVKHREERKEGTQRLVLLWPRWRQKMLRDSVAVKADRTAGWGRAGEGSGDGPGRSRETHLGTGL